MKISTETVSIAAAAVTPVLTVLGTWLMLNARVRRLERTMEAVTQLLLSRTKDRPLNAPERRFLREVIRTPEIAATL